MTDVQRFADSRELRGVEHAVARILAETDRPVEVYAAVLEAIGGLLGWELGAVWEVGADDLRLQLETVLRRHLPAAAGGDRRLASVAEFSVELNLALAGGLHRRAAPWARLSTSFLALGPSGWKRYLRDSRIAERVGARLRLFGAPSRARAAA